MDLTELRNRSDGALSGPVQQNQGTIKALLNAFMFVTRYSVRSYRKQSEEVKKSECIDEILEGIGIDKRYEYEGIGEFYRYFLEKEAQDRFSRHLDILGKGEVEEIVSCLKEFFREKITYIRDKIFQNPARYIMEYNHDCSKSIPFKIFLREDTFQQLIDDIFSSYIISPDFLNDDSTEQFHYLSTMNNKIRSVFNKIFGDNNYFKKRKKIAPKYLYLEGDYWSSRFERFLILKYIILHPNNEGLMKLKNLIDSQIGKKFDDIIIECVDTIQSNKNQYFNLEEKGSLSYVNDNEIMNLIKKVFNNNLRNSYTLSLSDIATLKELVLYIIYPNGLSRNL